MRRIAVVGLAGIGVVFGASLLLVDRLTSPDTTPGPLPDGAPSETENRVEAPRTPNVPPPVVPPPDAAPAPPPAPGPVELTAAVSARLAASASQVDLGERLETLRARVTSRCGTLVLREAEDPSDPTRGLEGEAVLLLELHVADGEARVFGSKILSQGAMRPALTACAQYALRNQVLRTFGGQAGTLTIPVVVSMPDGSR